MKRNAKVDIFNGKFRIKGTYRISIDGGTTWRSIGKVKAITDY